MSDYQTILLDVADGVATLTLNRPAKVNAASPQMMDEMRDALDSLEKRGARALLIKGAGRGFCSGADFSRAAIAVADRGLDPTNDLKGSLHPAIIALTSLRLPVVAAVHGACTGIGVSLAFAADFVVASRSAFFFVSFINVGLVPDGGLSWMLPRLVGRGRAAEMMMLGERVGADRAAEWGLVYKVTEDEALEAEAHALARRLADGPTVALGLIHQSFAEARGQTLEAALEAEIERQRVAALSADAREGFAAFIAKRAPKFTGR